MNFKKMSKCLFFFLVVLFCSQVFSQTVEDSASTVNIEEKENPSSKKKTKTPAKKKSKKSSKNKKEALAENQENLENPQVLQNAETGSASFLVARSFSLSFSSFSALYCNSSKMLTTSAIILSSCQSFFIYCTSFFPSAGRFCYSTPFFAQISARQHLSQYGFVRAVQTSLP